MSCVTDTHYVLDTRMQAKYVSRGHVRVLRTRMPANSEHVSLLLSMPSWRL